MQSELDYETRRRVLRKLRQRAGISQRALSRLTGVAYESVCRFERGQRDLSAETLRKLEDGLSDLILGQRTTRALQEQRGQTAALSVMTSTPRSRKRKRDELVSLREENTVLRSMIEVLKERDQHFHEAYTLMTEAIRLYEAEIATRPKEVGALLRRARLVIAKE